MSERPTADHDDRREAGGCGRLFVCRRAVSGLSWTAKMRSKKPNRGIRRQTCNLLNISRLPLLAMRRKENLR
jgi:hypothetical protein